MSLSASTDTRPAEQPSARLAPPPEVGAVASGGPLARPRGWRGRLRALLPGSARVPAKADAAVPAETEGRSWPNPFEAPGRNDPQASGGGFGRVVWRSYLGLVVAPVLLLLAYLALYASDQYVVEAKLTVRAGERSVDLSAASGLFSRLGIATPNGSTVQDVQIVLNYIRSRAILTDLGGKAVMGRYFGGDQVDYFSRLDATDDIEEIWKYWQSKVTASVDGLSGILTLRVRAFRAEDTLQLATDIVARSEALVNRVSEISRQDALTRARSEVDRAAAQLAGIRQELLTFRNQNASIDPVNEAKSIATLITQLTIEKLEIESDIQSVAGLIDRTALVNRQRQLRLDALNRQIAELQAKLTTVGGDNTISQQLAEFELLQLRTGFAEKLYTIAQNSYQQARQEMERQQLFLVEVVRPTLPEEALYPKVILQTLLALVALTVIWGIIVLIAASIRDHMV